MSIIELTKDDKNQLATWIGYKGIELRLIYSATRDGCSNTAFHQKCDGKAPLLVIASNSAGYTFGGYASIAWTSQSANVPDAQSFLYRLRKNNTADYVKYASNGGHVMSNASYGPCFGNGNNFALYFVKSAITKQADNLFPCANLTVSLTYGYNNNGHDSEELHGGDNQLYNIEVYEVTEIKLYPEESPWRKGVTFDEQMLANLKGEISSYEPYKELNVPQVRVLLTGQIGAGKSSFFNTVNSTFRGHVTSQAVAGSSEHSITTKFRTYDIRQRRGGPPLKIKFCDTMGLEEELGMNISDLPYILDGNIQDRFQFNPAMLVTPDHPEFKSAAKLKDKIHVIALVVDANVVKYMTSKIVEKLINIRKHANQRNVPTVIILTKIDQICPYVDEDISKVFHSMAVKEHVDTIAEKIGIPKSQILPVKNYDSEMELEASIDILALSAVRQILRAADSFFDDQLDLLGIEPGE